MSKYLSKKLSTLTPYVPGEQPQDMKYIKLNTNESPFPPSKKAIEEANIESERLMLYSDPECHILVNELSSLYGIDKDQVLFTNGSDEILYFSFMAFCEEDRPAVFPDITYGFYPVYAEINNIPYIQIPLKDDFSIDINDYTSINKPAVFFIANPNAPTGIILSVNEIEKLLISNPNGIVVVDEAYVDFGTESCVKLINKYDNLLVTQTFSKSRSMAGARLGFGIGNKELIKDLSLIKYSTNPYNINRMTMAAGVGVLRDEEYTKNNCQTIIDNRKFTSEELKKLGFILTDSKANFIFAKHPNYEGEYLYKTLKSKGVLVRHFSNPRISDYLRITIGTKQQMTELINQLKLIVEE